MKTLPLLTLDLTRAKLELKNNFVEVVDQHERTVAHIFAVDGDYDHAGIILDRLNGYSETIDALRKLAIIPTMMHGVQNLVVHDGFRCRVCRSTFKIGAQEIHANDCPLKGTTP